MGSFGRWTPGAGAANRLRTRRLRLSVIVLIPVVAACLLVLVMPSHAVVGPSLAAARSTPGPGMTKATALKAQSGRTYTVTLTGQSSQRWLVVNDPYNPLGPCSGRCPFREAGAASALVGATVQSLSGACIARVTLLGPTFNEQSGRVTERQLGEGLVASGAMLTAVGVPTWFGRVYLELTPDSSMRCSNARYAVSLTVQRALATGTVAAVGSASAAQYDTFSTTLAQKQSICFHKGQALDRYTSSLTRQISADQRRHGPGGTIARLRAAINAANRAYLATPCPPR